MQPDKLNRLEKPEWHPPELSFQIERHGATVMGSSRAALYKWILDLETRQASCVTAGHRQLRPMDERLDVKPIAKSLAEAIISGEDDPRLRRNSDGTVRVKIGDVVPETNIQTTSGRRKRLRTELSDLLRERAGASFDRTSTSVLEAPSPKRRKVSVKFCKANPNQLRFGSPNGSPVWASRFDLGLELSVAQDDPG